MSMQPSGLLTPGDSVEVTITDIGHLRNVVQPVIERRRAGR